MKPQKNIMTLCFSFLLTGLFLSNLAMANQIVFIKEQKFLDVHLKIEKQEHEDQPSLTLYLKECEIVEENLAEVPQDALLSTEKCTDLGDRLGYSYAQISNEKPQVLQFLATQMMMMRTMQIAGQQHIKVGGNVNSGLWGVLSGLVGYFAVPSLINLVLDKTGVNFILPSFSKWISASVLGLGMGYLGKGVGEGIITDYYMPDLSEIDPSKPREISFYTRVLFSLTLLAHGLTHSQQEIFDQSRSKLPGDQYIMLLQQKNYAEYIGHIKKMLGIE